MKILIAADGSSYTKRMLAYLVAHDEWLGARHTYTVLSVVPPVPAIAVADLAGDAQKAHYEEEAEKVFKPIRAFLARHGLAIDYLSMVGAASESIAATARDGKYDLLMMGSHGHGALGNLVLGSVTTKVMTQCSTPVLLVR